MHDIAILFEHPEWQKPHFEALKKRGLDFTTVDLKKNAFHSDEALRAKVVFNQASPSAYTRGNVRAVPQALALLRHYERLGAKVINGSEAFLNELSKAAQVALCRALDIDHPHSIIFNDVEAAIEALNKLPAAERYPRLLKPDLGGSGARIAVIEDESALRQAFMNEDVWAPDNLFLLQEYLAHDKDFGIVRLEFVNGELLYPMRVVTHGRFNLCPSPVCNPESADESGACEIPSEEDLRPVEFYPYKDVPLDVVSKAKRILKAAKIDIGGVEYLETPEGRRVFYDVNANSNLRPQVAEHFGVEPFEKVVDFLEEEVAKA